MTLWGEDFIGDGAGSMRSPVPHHCRLPFDPLALILEYAADKVIMCGAHEV